MEIKNEKYRLIYDYLSTNSTLKRIEMTAKQDYGMDFVKELRKKTKKFNKLWDEGMEGKLKTKDIVQSRFKAKKNNERER